MESDDQEYMETGTGVMVSNLPLLFARGTPTSLHRMSLVELEVFVPFMVRCSVGEERPVPWSQLPRPSWWPRKLPFRMPTTNNTSATVAALVSVVERCYTYHGCEYLLQFCASLTAQMPSSGYRFNDNRDGTTSMYHGCTGKLLVTFRNENRDYDKYCHEGRSIQKKLLLSPSTHNERRGSNGTTAMFQPPIRDIYLCDKCENEFYSLREVQTHERQCRGDTPASPAVPSPEPEPADEDLEPTGQVPFLAYLNLQPAEHTGIKPYMSPRKRNAISPPRKLFGPTYPRYDSISLSSPLGKFLLANSKFRNKYQATQHLVMKYERNLRTTQNAENISSRERCMNRWIVVWRPRKEEQPWVHKYCFTNAQKQERKSAIETGLDRRSRDLLRKCRPCRIKIKRLQKNLLDCYRRLGQPTALYINQADEIQSMTEQQTPFVNSVSEEPWLEQCTLPRTEVNIGASSSFVAACSNPLASTSSQLPRNTLFQDGSRVTLRQPDNCLQYADSHRYAFTYGDRFPHGREENEQQAVHQGPDIFLSHQPKGRWNQDLQFLYQDTDNMAIVHGSHSHQNKDLQEVKPAKINSSVLQDLCDVKTKSKKVVKDLSDEWCNSNSEVQVVKIFKNNESKFSTDSRFQNTNVHPVTKTGVMQTVRSGVVSVPHIFENSKDSLSINSASVSISRTNTPIEIIDLSSDDDESGKSRRQNEADNAPQQLNGLNCYPHSGAKIPFSSKHSLPKNGNSHWSSKQESHCGAGRLGDLAINGQPPNVPPNLSISPVPDSAFLPLAAPPVVSGESGMKPNIRKRKHESLTANDRKILILDTSHKYANSHPNSKTEYEKVRNENVEAQQSSQFRMCTQKGFPVIHGEEAIVPEVLDGEYFFRHEDTIDQGSHGLIIDDEISFKPPFHVDEDISFNITERPLNIEGSGRQRKSNVELEGVSKEMVVTKEASMNSQEKHVQSVETPVVGFISNIVNTVNKGVEFFKALVGSSINDKICNPGDKQTKLKCKNMSSMNTLKETSRSNRTEDESGKKIASGRKKCREMDKLLKDECRELQQRGLGELRHLNIPEARLTRRSVERYIPNKTKIKRACGFKHYSIRSSPYLNRNFAEKSTQEAYTTDSKKRTNVHRNETTDLSKADPHSGKKDYVPKVDFCIPLLEVKPISKNVDKKLFTDIALPGGMKNISPVNVDILDDCIDENGNSPTYSGISIALDKDKDIIKGLNLDTVRGSEICHYLKDTVGREICMDKNKTLQVDKIDTPKLKAPASETNRNRYKGARELLNLANDEWKEISRKGFHPLKIIKPALIRKVLQVEDREKSQNSPRSNMPKELHMLVQKEFQTGYHSTSIQGSFDKELQTDYNCALSSCQYIHSSDVKAGNLFRKQKKTNGSMGETTEGHSVLLTDVSETEYRKFLLSNTKPLSTHTNVAWKSLAQTKESVPYQSEPVDEMNLERSTEYLVKKSKTKPYLSRELSNLAGDEWKEMQGKGFHPSHLLGMYNGKLGCDCLTDEENTPKVKSQHIGKETNNSSPEFSDEKPNPKLSRELFRLLRDECKELQPVKLRLQKSKPHSRKKLQPFGLKRLQEAYKSADISTRRRSLLQNISIGSACTPRVGCHKIGKKSLGMTGTKTQQTRNTRSQTNILSNVEACTPRSSHREILQTELAMCVLNYDLPAIL